MVSFFPSVSKIIAIILHGFNLPGFQILIFHIFNSNRYTLNLWVIFIMLMSLPEISLNFVTGLFSESHIFL